ncbi:reverse transcriptase family protein [Desulfurivibrio sp. D14AmB]|uniref:reverse transcriptase family protein n=1 Tax=Desulfurivibrio sp. D14AmB TaxID=3374370 RepID=UPI00376F41C0
MSTISVGKRELFLRNLRLVNERAGVEPEVIDLLEAFARLELDRGRPPNLAPARPPNPAKKVRLFLAANNHLPASALDFLAAYCQRIYEQGVVCLLNPAHLAQTVSLPLNRLQHLIATAEHHYYSYQIPKSDGSTRLIHAPQPELKKAQRSVLDEILAFVPLNPHAEGFRRRRSIVTNSRRHVANRVVVKLDIEDFFPSITAQRIFGVFTGLGYPRQVAELLTGLTTRRGVLPTGAPTSPFLSNLVCRRLDRRLAGVGEKMDYEYSRYADDLTFSSQNKKMTQLLPFLQEIIREEGFAVKTAKTRIQRNGGQQKVTGIVVNSRPNIARREIRNLQAIIHNCRRQGDLQLQAYRYAAARGAVRPEQYTIDALQASLRGKINLVRQVNPAIGERLLRDFLTISFHG